MIEVKNLTKSYRPRKGEPVQALKGINLQFEEKGLVFILGKSGSGKSTLLNMLGGLDQFDGGEIIIKGKSSKQFAQADFDSYRNTFIGFIFQEYNILNDFTVGANIALAMELQGKKPTNEMLQRILREVDLEGFADRKPNELSGGQKQRVAIARALIKNPEIIMADEPTGALDSNTGKQVFDTLKRLSKDKLVIVVSHDREFAEQYGDRVIEMKDGQVISDIKKYTAKTSNVSEGMQIIDEKIIHIKSGYELTEQDLTMINEYLRKNRENDSFISLDSRTNDKIKQAAQIDENGNQQAFEDTSKENLEIKQYDSSQLQLIRSKLPFKSSLKMAAGSLKKKPFRLAMTILLSTVSFSLFGLVNTMSSYDRVNSGADSIIDSNVDYMAFTKEKEVKQYDWSYYTSQKLSDEDVNTIQEKFDGESFTKVITANGSEIQFGSAIAESSKLEPYNGFAYYPSSFSGIAQITEEQIQNMGYTLTGALPKSDTDIVITNVIAESFVQGGYLDPLENNKKVKITKAEEMVGKKLRLSVNSDKLYTITGVIDTKFDGSRYEMFTREQDPSVSGMNQYMLQSEFMEVRTNSFHNLVYVTEGFYQEILANNIGVDAYGATYDVMLNGDDDMYFPMDEVAEITELSADKMKDVVFLDSNKSTLNQDEIIISSAMLEQNAKLYAIVSNSNSKEELKKAIIENKDKIKDIKLSLDCADANDDWNVTSTKVTIAGIYVDSDNADALIGFMPEGFLKEHNIDNSGKYNSIIGKMPTDRADILDVVSYSFDNGIEGIKYSLSNCTSDLLETVNSLIEEVRTTLLVVGIGFAVFAGLMLMNFISISISYRKREIGILRAVGARGRDVFVIFFKESAIIALINWVFAVVAAAAAVGFTNSIFRTNYNFVVTIFHFGILQVILMLGLSLFVAFTASFIPVYRVSKKKPIEVIRKN